MLAGNGLPFPGLLAVAAEILGPVALILGIAPRLTAVLLIAFTLAISQASCDARPVHTSGSKCNVDRTN
jgi:putative oxidoreductase